MKSPAFKTYPVIAVFLLTACITGTQSPAPIAIYGTRQGAGSAGIHTTIKGDTLWSISNRYNIAMRDIAVANGLQAPFELPPGIRLRLPPPQQYTAKNKDTLYSVSRLFGVSPTEIASLNQLREPYVLSPGQVLRLPTLTRKTAPAPETVIASVPQVDAPIHIEPLPDTSYTPAPAPSPVAPSSEYSSDYASPQVEPTAEPAEARVAAAVPQPKPTFREKITAQTPKRASSRFLKPVEGSIISAYGPKANGQHNDGINIKAPMGAPIRAADNGVVVYAGNELKGSGNLVLIRHDGRWMTAYAHMDTIQIKRGDVIKRGQTIGTVGSTGSVDEPQLHFEVRRGTEAINPKQYLEG